MADSSASPGSPDALHTLPISEMGTVLHVGPQSATTPGPAGDAPAELPAMSIAGRYSVLRLHAEGGLGRVSVALDESLRREVALKQIRPEVVDDPRSRMRFLTEAEITGQLEHPGIVPVYVLGHDDRGLPYYAMKFVRGRTLAEAITAYRAGERQPRVLRELLRRFVAVCEAVAYAHSRGIIHRDLKPANIMLGDFGETLVLDWGLAKRVEEGSGFGVQGSGGEGTEARRHEGTKAETNPQSAVSNPQSASPEPRTLNPEPSPVPSPWATRAGAVLGTPAYMPPEQASGETAKASPLLDVYALGAILYQMLTGEPPHVGSSHSEVLSKVRQARVDPKSAPTRPSRRHADVPAALEAICLKAMNAHPEQRYASAEALAADLENWLSDEPVTAHREPLLARAGRWARRHRTPVAAAAALLVTAVVALAISNVLIGRQKANVQAKEAEARHEARTAKLRLADALVAQGNAYAWAMRWEDARVRYDEARELYGALGASPLAAELGLSDLYRASPPAIVAMESPQLPTPRAAAFLPDGQRALIGGRTGALNEPATGVVLLVDLPTRRVLRSFGPHGTSVTSIAVSRDGRAAVCGADNGIVKVWDLESGGPVAEIAAHDKAITAVALTPDGKLAISASEDGTLKAWELSAFATTQSTTRSATQPALSHLTRSRALSSTGFQPVTATGWKPVLRIAQVDSASAPTQSATADAPPAEPRPANPLDRASPQPLHTFRGHRGAVLGASLSADGRRLVSIGFDLTVRSWNVADGRALKTMGPYTALMSGVALHSEGKLAATAAHDGHVAIWDVEAGQLQRLVRHSAMITGVAFSSRGMVLSASSDRTLVLWEAGSGTPMGAFGGHGQAADVVCFSPDGRLAMSVARDRTLKVWDTGLSEVTMFGQPVGMPGGSRLSPSMIFTRSLALMPDGHAVLHGGMGTLTLADLATGQELVRCGPMVMYPIAIAVAPDAKTAATITFASTIQVWDLTTGRPIRGFYGSGGKLTSLAWSPDGRFILVGDAGRSMALHEATTEKVVRTFGPQAGAVTGVAFAPDGGMIASAGDDGVVRLWDAASGKELRALAGHAGPVRAVRFLPVAPNGMRQLITAGDDRTLRLWDAASGQLLRTFTGHADPALCVAVSGDGRFAVSGGADNTVKMWDIATGRELHSFRAHLNPVRHVAITADGQTVVSGADDGYGIMWDLNRAARHREFAARLAAAQMALEKNADDPAALATLGEWYAFRGQAAWAVALLERARAATPPGGAEIPALPLARSYWRLGRKQEAAAEFQRAIERKEAPQEYLKACLEAGNR